MRVTTRQSILSEIIDDDELLARLTKKHLDEWPSRDQQIAALAEATWIELWEILTDVPKFDLTFACRVRDLSESGSKQQLVERLCDHLEDEDNGASEQGRVFIVHGHDNVMLLRVQQFLMKLGIETTVLADQPNKGMTIIEKLMEEGDRCDFAVVLFSPDDKLATGGSRARQNVVLELGLFIGALGRGRVAVVNRGDVELPSDIHGVLYTPFDGFEIRLGRELLAAGFEVDLNRIA